MKGLVLKKGIIKTFLFRHFKTSKIWANIKKIHIQIGKSKQFSSSLTLIIVFKLSFIVNLVANN